MRSWKKCFRSFEKNPNSGHLWPDKAKGAFGSESALHSFDGDKPNSVCVIDVDLVLRINQCWPAAFAAASATAINFSISGEWFSVASIAC